MTNLQAHKFVSCAGEKTDIEMADKFGPSGEWKARDPDVSYDSDTDMESDTEGDNAMEIDTEITTAPIFPGSRFIVKRVTPIDLNGDLSNRDAKATTSLFVSSKQARMPMRLDTTNFPWALLPESESRAYTAYDPPRRIEIPKTQVIFYRSLGASSPLTDHRTVLSAGAQNQSYTSPYPPSPADLPGTAEGAYTSLGCPNSSTAPVASMYAVIEDSPVSASIANVESTVSSPIASTSTTDTVPNKARTQLPSSLIRHTTLEIPPEEASSEQIDSPTDPSSDEQSKALKICLRCHAVFSTVKEVTAHRRECPNADFELGGPIRDSNGYKIGSRPWSCPACPVSHRSPKHYRLHIIRDHLNIWLGCPHCDVSFYLQSGLREHVDEYHPESL